MTRTTLAEATPTVHRRRLTRLATAALCLAATGGTVLAACSPGTPATPGAGGTPPVTSSSGGGTATTPPPSSETSITEGTSGTEGPSATTPATKAPSTTASSHTAAAASTRCTRASTNLKLGETHGAAGSVYIQLVVTNTGSAACTLTGYPGVSLVYGSDGKQLGAAAVRDKQSWGTPKVTIKPRASATTEVRLARAQNYDDSTCHPQQAAGFRVYLPDETGADFLATKGFEGCLATGVSLLGVQSFH